MTLCVHIWGIFDIHWGYITKKILLRSKWYVYGTFFFIMVLYNVLYTKVLDRGVNSGRYVCCYNSTHFFQVYTVISPLVLDLSFQVCLYWQV